MLEHAVVNQTRKLSEKKARLNQVIEENPIPTFAIDNNRMVTHWNKACEVLTGQSAGTIVGTNNYPQAIYNDRCGSIVDLLLDNVLKKRRQIHEDTTYSKSDVAEDIYETERFFSNLGDNGKWLHGTASLLKNESGDIVGAIETWQDHTSCKRLEKQRTQSQKMEALGTLSGHIVHDFNNILSAIIGHSDVALIHLPDDSPSRRNVDKAIDAAMRAKELINQIDMFSRRTEVEGRPIQVSKIVKETLQLFTASLPTNIKIVEDICSDAKVIADDIQLHKIVMNLCTNAYKAMADDGGTLTIRLYEVTLDEDYVAAESDLIPGPYLKLTMIDTGQGIAPDIQDHVFEPFFTTRRKGLGTGMGLSIVYGIVKGCGGKIDCVSKIGDGTTFNIYLPVVPGNANQNENTIWK